ncbi:hypothetical protein DFH11DRAFT_1510920 [Phellopilus nigrolimitatus]|nr:hypothetical protein DFH11DRAFT_1510920 [Phellopilus nigrolimitatus]
MSCSPNDFKCRISSSIESDHSALVNPHMSEREIEQCRNFACCGLPLPDLHELIEHFETHHVFVVDPSSSTYANGSLPPGTTAGMPARSSDSSLAGALGQGMPAASGSSPPPTHNRQSSLSLSMAGGVAAFDPDDMELDLEADSPPSSSSSHSSPEAGGVSLPAGGPYRFTSNGSISSVMSSPPDTPLLATPVSPVHSNGFVNGTQQSAFPWGAQASTDGSLQSQAQSNAALVASALNGYSGYSDYSRAFPGTLGLGSSQHMGAVNAGASARTGSADGIMNAEGAIHPSLLFGGSRTSTPAPNAAGARPGTEVNTPMTTPAQSRASSPSSNAAPTASSSTSARKPGSSSTLGTPSTTLSRPASSLLLSKPFKCPKAGCMKSYKQANGLKYHVTHGQCNFNPPPELSSVEGLTEREAERRLRPFCCQVPPCQRRYKNMNGLRYHYQHSGDHGAVGLALLASGNHDATRSQPSPPAISLDTDVPAAGAHGHGHGHGGAGAGTMSAPPTPAPAPACHAGRFAQGQAQFATQSQPASAYASPWGSPRSGSPYQAQAQASQPIQVPQPQQPHGQTQGQLAYPQAQWAVDTVMS